MPKHLTEPPHMSKPINMRAHEIRALLAGTKTQHRVVLKPQPETDFVGAGIGTESLELRPACMFGGPTHKMLRGLPRTRDHLWVREEWGHDAPDLDSVRRGVESGGVPYGPYYMADADWFDNATVKRLSSIHMPRWASRLTLIVKEVRVKRLQDISREDAIAEGWGGGLDSQTGDGFTGNGPRTWFRKIWNGIHSEGAWAANPWICALTFTVHRTNIDALELTESENA